MIASELTGKAQTVLGHIAPDDLGVTLTHEHLLIDLSGLARHSPDTVPTDIYSRKVSLETLGYIQYYFADVADNNRLLDVETAIEEVALYKQHGGSSLVEATNIGIVRNPLGLRRIAFETGVNIIMGSSYYVGDLHPPDMDAKSEDEIVAEVVLDITKGVDDTGVRAGIIGEVGCSWPLTDNERKVLRASARAQSLTGAPLLIHPGRNERSPEQIIGILRDAGADLGKTIMGHLDRTVTERATLKQIVEAGCYLEWDLFGREQSYYVLDPGFDLPSDAKRLDDIAWAVSQGYGDKVVIAHDIFTKHRLLKYGGHGYFYILANIVPRMRERGFDEASINKILVDNPARALTFSAPSAP